MIRDELDTMVKQITDQLGLPETATLVLPNKGQNAAVTWLGGPVVILTQGLVEQCSPQMVQAIVAHELAHLKLNHPWHIGAIRGAIATLLAGMVLLHAWRVAAIAAPVLLVLYFLYSRMTEYAADSLGASMVGTPFPMMAWLSIRKTGPSFTHPSAQSRIQRLSKCA